MALFLSQLAAQAVTKPKEGHAEHSSESGALPLLASPVNAEAYDWLKKHSRKASIGPGKIKRSLTIAQFEAEHEHEKLATRLFRKQTVASTLELYFDLFFVGNLAVFTGNHAHVDAQSVANYIGFFTILWTTWFHITIHDCRFFADSVLARIFKITQFGVMVAFVGLGPVYDSILVDGESRAFNGLGLVMMSIRFEWALQYALVLYFLKGFQKTLAPLLCTTVLYLVTGFALLGVYLADDSSILLGREGATKVNAWYVIIAVEAVAVVIISSIWRVLSFKHTHLVERVGLLTLIIMGEGIIGLLKSTAYILNGTNVSIWGVIGLVAPAVLIIYFIYLLYFGGIHHDRFGTIRQQIWALLHYVLHVAILLTVEGQSAMLIWAATREGVQYVNNHFPSPLNPSGDAPSITDLINNITTSINLTTERYHYAKLSKVYNPQTDIDNLRNISTEYGSEEWIGSASEIVSNVLYNMQEYIFVNYNAEGSEIMLEEATSAEETVQIYDSGFRTTYEYLYITAGGFLVLLAVMFWFGKEGKNRHDFGSIISRVLVGFSLACVSAIAFFEKPGETMSFRFTQPYWVIPIITFAYLFVLVSDNLIKIFVPIGSKVQHLEAVRANDQDEKSFDEAVQGLNSKQRHHPDGSEDYNEPMLGQKQTQAGMSRKYSVVQQHDDDDEHNTPISKGSSPTTPRHG